MQREFIEKRTMALVVKEYILKSDAGILAGLPMMDAIFARFVDRLELLSKASMDQSANRKGFRKVKDDSKVAMVRSAMDVCGRLKAFAAVSEDVVLAKEVGFGYAVLFKKADGVCADLCGFIYKKGVALAADLVAYGVTEAMLSDLTAKVSEFRKQVPKPRMGIVQRKQATRQIKRLIKELDADLAVMDALVGMLRYSNEDFYSVYFSSRRLVRIGYRKLAIEGVVVDVDGLPMEHVSVSVLDTKVVRQTGAMGGFEVRRLKSKVYGVWFSKPGYLDVFVDVAVTRGMRSSVKVVMERSFVRSA